MLIGGRSKALQSFGESAIQMRVPVSNWRRSILSYRMLVAAQTIALAGAALMKVILRRSRGSLTFDSVSLTWPLLSLVAIVAGVVVYRSGQRTKDSALRRGTIIVSWTCFLIAGVFALVGYALTGGTTSFLAGIVSLTVMHVFSPNRLPNAEELAR